MALRRPGSISLDQPTATNKRLIWLLSVVTVIGVLIGLVGVLSTFVVPEKSSDANERKTVAARVTDFAVAYNTYDVAKVDDYQSRMKGLLSDSYYTEFVKVTDSIFKGLAGKKQVSKDAKVLQVAVDSIDKNSAVALVAVDASITNTDVKAAVARHLRWKVSLVKDDGSWNIDTFESVGTLNAETGEPTPTTPTPTEGADK